MKKQIAIMLTLLMAAGTFTACRLEEKVNNDIKTSVVRATADVSVSETAFGVSTINQAETTATEETKATENATVSQKSKTSEKDTQPNQRADSGQNSAVVSATEPTEAVQSSKTENKSTTQKATQHATQKPTAKPTQPPLQKPTEKPTQRPTQSPENAKTVDVNSAVNSAISYGKQLGMHYDGFLNISNASWFSPTNASYYDSTSELTADLKSDVEYVAYYYQSSGIAPSDLSFNVIAKNNKIYVVYC